MSKSNYPNKLDTSVEIPVIRDNITEIGSDVLNSLRAAIFNIERTLGINPQGAAGNTVAARLSNVVDENGNILKEALDRSNILSGPIVDADVSKVAAIDENKLRLNFPTQLLQDQVSILDNRLNLFIQTLEELNAILSSHIHQDATNRHYAKAITIETAEADPSSDATLLLESGTLQDILEEIYNAHMHYTGEGIGASNNSHIAKQIFYDNEKTSDVIPSTSVQGAIDDLADSEGQVIRNALLNFNSNGMIRSGSVNDEFEGLDSGTVLVEASLIAYSGPDGTSREVISFPDNPTPVADPAPFDILTIIDSPNEDDNRDYLISNVELTPGGNIDYIEVFGGPGSILEPGTNARVSKNIYVAYNENGLNCSVRPRYLRSNTPDIQVAHPNAATIISSTVKTTSLVDGSVDTLAIEIDGGDTLEINVFNSDYALQTLEMVVDKINQYSVENKLNIFAYKVRTLRCFELAISHVLPNFAEDSRNRTIKIVEASSNDASGALGLTYILDKEVEGAAGNAYHINGRLLEDFGKILKYSSDSLAINVGTTNLNSVSVDFYTEGIREGDLCIIDGSSNPGDDGTYRISSITSDVIILDSPGITLQGEITDDSSVFILRCSAPIGEMEFKELDGLVLFDVFLDQEKDVNYKKRLDVVGHLKDSGFYAVVSDISKGFIGEDDVYELKVDTDGMASILTHPAGIEGDPVFVASTGTYKVYSPDKFNFVILDVYASSVPSTTDTLTLYGYSEIPDSVLHLSRGVYSTEFGFVLGSPSESGGGIPILTDKRVSGTVDDTIVGEALLERYVQGPRNELRGSGVIRGTNIDLITDNEDGTCVIDIYPGVVVVNGIRIEYLGITDLGFKYDTGSTTNFYIAIDGHGCLLIENEIDASGGTDYISPFANQNVAHLAYVEVSSPDVTVTDLRLFVDHLDYKVIADITVANDQRFGHFTDIKTAVDYARMFTQTFPNMGTPSITIKEGTYEVSSVIFIDFDTIIRGAGPQTVIKRSFIPTNTELVDETEENAMFLVGRGYTVGSTMVYGVTLEDLTFVGTEGEPDTSGGTFVMVRNNVTLGNSDSATFIFNRLKFVASSNYVVPGGSDISLGGGPNQMPFHIGYGSAGTYQNIIISNCYFKGVGYQLGAIYLNSDNHYKNISITNNISVDSIDTASGYSMYYDGGAISLTNVQEVGNMIVSI